jgi:glutamate--cysteine ligase
VSDSAERLTSVADLVADLRAGEKPRENWRVGTEHEKIGVYSDTRQRVPYEGERGIGALLDRIAKVDGWDRVEEEGNVIALQKDSASITLEPGGQLELSGAPLFSAKETCAEFNRHVDLVKEQSRDFGIEWLALGIDPFHAVDAIPHMPKARYGIMRDYLPTRGGSGLLMMHSTATVQANFDYADEADMVAKLRMAMACSPITSALFANSSISEGRPNGYISRRVEIWRDVDPDRCGILDFVFDENFGYREYVEWALDVPMFFVVRDHRYLPAKGMTFREFLRAGFDGAPATRADWNLHLTTVFPEVRLKRFIEVRGTDCVPRDLICALPTLWKGLLYHDGALEAAWDLVRGWTAEDRNAALMSAARHGLGGRVADRSMLDLAKQLVEISREGLRGMAQRPDSAGDEGGFLDPLAVYLERGQSPGEIVLEAWRGEWRESPERLIEFARY